MKRALVAILLAGALTLSPAGLSASYADSSASAHSPAKAVQTSRKTTTLNADDAAQADPAASPDAAPAADGATDGVETAAETPRRTIKTPPEYDPDAWDAATLDYGDPDYPYQVESDKRAASLNTYSTDFAPTKPVLTKIRMGFYDQTQDAVDIPASSLLIKGYIIPYVDWRTHDDAPDRNAGWWEGNESTLDGHWGYFIGHNPGDFTPVYYLNEGDPVYIRDSKGYLGSYTVTKIIVVDYGSQLGDLRYDIEPLGEAVVLQTCINGGAQLRVVICEAPRPYVYQT